MKSNLRVFAGGHRTSLADHVTDKQRYLVDVALTHRRIVTKVGIINEPGHAEPWIIAMSDAPGYLITLDYSARWGIKPMFCDFKSRGFGLERSQLRTPDRLGRLLPVMSLALYFAVSTGLWDAATNATVDGKKSAASASQSEPQQAVLVHAERPAHPSTTPVQTTNAALMGIRMKLMGVEVRLSLHPEPKSYQNHIARPTLKRV